MCIGVIEFTIETIDAVESDFSDWWFYRTGNPVTLSCGKWSFCEKRKLQLSHSWLWQRLSFEEPIVVDLDQNEGRIAYKSNLTQKTKPGDFKFGNEGLVGRPFWAQFGGR